MRPFFLFTFLLTATAGLCQSFSTLRIDSLPPQGILLDKGWTWHAGDNPDWAKPTLDDSRWRGIDPTKDIFELPQIQKTGQIYWLRLRLAIDSSLNQQLVLMIQQVGASEIYLNGKLIHRFGVVSATTDQIKAFNPRNSPISFPVNTNAVQVLAIRYAFQPNIRYTTHFGMTNPLFRIKLQPTNEAVLEYANLYNQEHNLNFAAVWAILSLLFFTLYIFFPVRKAHLYFSVYTLLFAVAWYLFSSVKQPAFVETFYGISNAGLILWGTGYLFMLNTVYATFQSKKGIFYWAIVLCGIVALLAGVLVYGWGWISFGHFFSNLISIDITRVSLIAFRQHRRGAWILLAGGICYLVCWFVFSLQFSGIISLGDTISGMLFEISILSISVAFAGFLAYDFGLTNRILEQKLTEVETLSAEKQQILATQNETLERQVSERTTELQHSLEALKATQTQLIQKEKMASLGELTAGIAHEIQNPLNFVNNFSEVSTELLGELKEEAATGNQTEVLAIADDLTQNLQKITLHGQRASSIVRGMLEHSRSLTGEKQLTDFNALTEEYLRLSYHGVRAKNKDFNAELKTDFDPALSKVDVVPQELGRVLLNLFNNAFYAVAERQKNQNLLGLKDLTGLNGLASYQPTVSVSTSQQNGQVEIRVADNGGGIPNAIREKIFQPFFTTKPTGQGTGLGLSLSYDIITKGHGGTLTVESREGNGAEFRITLPV